MNIKKRITFFSAILLFIAANLFAQKSSIVEIKIDASAGRKPISPLIYGKNNSLSDDPNKPLSAADWKFLRHAGVKMFRESSGNNSTKYNWKLKLSSHPDWYNNVYDHDWDFEAKSLQHNVPGVRGMFSFQLLGKVAGNKDNNFNDWKYNKSQWSKEVNKNWAGGGGPDKPNGNPNLYLTDFSADDTVGILDHWFNPKGIGIDKKMFQYWNMDNEPEIWSGTHDDAVTTNMPVEIYMKNYFEVAKKARVKYPKIKLVGPVTCNEWQWYNWNNEKIKYEDKEYVFLEYFIKRIAEEQKSGGIRLLDVLDIHFYPQVDKPTDILQLHRVWFDRTYDYPKANGAKRLGPGSWNADVTKEYIFGRCADWLEQYMGTGHGVTFGVSEMGIKSNDPNIIALWHASTMGVFADEGVEIFTPWHWTKGNWEALHLFSRYSRKIRVASSSSDKATVSAYSSISKNEKSMTIMLVNRDLEKKQDVNIIIDNFEINDGTYKALRLNNLPKNEETFRSHKDNALKEKKINVSNNAFNMSLPPLSITAVLLSE